MSQTVELRPMTPAEYERFLQRNLARYVQELLRTGQTDVEAHAVAEAQGALDEGLPNGMDTPLHYFLAAEADGAVVGEVWCDTTEPETVFLNDFYVYEPHRRQGRGAAMLRAVETIAERGEFGRIVTHVFHTNRAALALFAAHGYLPCGGEENGTIFLQTPYPAPAR